jgi:hypothetical protein
VIELKAGVEDIAVGGQELEIANDKNSHSVHGAINDQITPVQSLESK